MVLGFDIFEIIVDHLVGTTLVGQISPVRAVLKTLGIVFPIAGYCLTLLVTSNLR